ncbi:MAG: response regulator, partial [Gammaproteobacteria bacterium]|nr:response regulator [Gammaproteobacteria bacterium]
LSDLPAKRGVILPLDKTFCQVTFASPETIAISHVAESEFKDHPAAEFLGMQSYIGCSINVHGKKFGTVNFSNRLPVKTPFTDADKDLVNLIGSWISVMMERQLDAEELQKSKELAELANRAKSTFLANMSHEIRTPLTAIIGYTDFAISETVSKEERIEGLKIIRGSGKHLLHLINDILDFSKIEAGEFELDKSPANLPDLIQEVHSIMNAQANLKGLHLNVIYQYPFPEVIVTDEVRLKQILLNLCSNAIKFTATGGVEIEASFNKADKLITIKVIDTGIGLTEEQLSTIFQPFKQADSGISKKYGGTGLGLSLSTQLAALLDGTLRASSELGKGSTFEVSLSLDDCSINEETNYLQSPEDYIHLEEDDEFVQLTGHILVAEDEVINQELIAMYLEEMGAEVTFVENGEQAVEKALKGDYDLVFMDMQMPVLSGIEAVIKLREQKYSGPIVMLSANATLGDKNNCKDAGCNNFITKPIDPDKMYSVTAQYLRKVTG